MRKFSILNNLKQLSLSLALVVTSYSAIPFLSQLDAHAGNKSSGVVLNRGRSVSRGGVARSRTGVSSSVQRRSSRQNISRLKLRQQQIFDRNALVQRQNELRFEQSLNRRVRPNGRPVLPTNNSGSFNGSISDGFGSDGVISGCASSFNCGYRIYSDGTGPRIIRPGIDAGGDLPAFDGVSGAKIITLD